MIDFETASHAKSDFGARTIVSIVVCVTLFVCRAKAASPASVEQWRIFEISLDGPRDGNPFVDVTVAAAFTSEGKTIDAIGFYDGDGVYRIRFMPPAQGQWKYVTRSNRNELAGKSGEFTRQDLRLTVLGWRCASSD